MPQMSPHADHAPAQPEQYAEDDDEHHMLGAEEDEPGKRAPAAVAEEQVSGVAEDQREEPTQQALERSFEQEGAANEPVGGAHQPHDGDLAGPLQQREPNG